MKTNPAALYAYGLAAIALVGIVVLSALSINVPGVLEAVVLVAIGGGAGASLPGAQPLAVTVQDEQDTP